MKPHRIEKVLKAHLKGIDKKLKKIENLESTAWFGSAIGVGLVLSTMTVHVLFLLGMTVVGLIFNLAADCVLPKKNSGKYPDPH